MAGWDAGAAARLRIRAREKGITQQMLAETLGVSLNTAQRYVAGTSDPGPDKLRTMTDRIGDTSVRYIMTGSDEIDPLYRVPIYDIDVAAGPGRVPLSEDVEVGQWGFPVDWVRDNFPTGAQLALVRVSGDSQEPDLRDGDLVMINRKDQRLRDGLSVVRVNEELLIKRVIVEARTAYLVSANPRHPERAIDLGSDDFAVIGRAVWAGKLL